MDSGMLSSTRPVRPLGELDGGTDDPAAIAIAGGGDGRGPTPFFTPTRSEPEPK